MGWMLRRGLYYKSDLLISISQGSTWFQAVAWNPPSESPWHMAVILQSEGVTLLRPAVSTGLREAVGDSLHLGSCGAES